MNLFMELILEFVSISRLNALYVNSNKMKKIKTLTSLYHHLDILYKKILNFCQKCKDPCCYGYVWLLEEEANRLSKKGVKIIEVNNAINFLHSFPVKNNKIILDRIKPPCVLSKNRQCVIYGNRPLFCRLYPIDIKKRGEDFYIILHKECLFIKTPHFLDNVIALFYNLDKELLGNIVGTFRVVDYLSSYPLGKEKPNSYIRVLKIKKQGGEIEMSKCKAVLDSEKVKVIRVKKFRKK